MGKGYLIDTNVLLDFLADKLPEKSKALLSGLHPEETYTSIVVKIEALGYNGPSQTMQVLTEFLGQLQVLPLTEQVADQTILIRKKIKIKLPDAIIAATALVHHLTLITRNTADFKKIEDLLLLDPWEM
jgi:toxin FitB